MHTNVEERTEFKKITLHFIGLLKQGYHLKGFQRLKEIVSVHVCN
jgi:hypothetical protein